MRKNVFVLIVLMSYPALAQISSGTIVIFNFTKDEIVIAADSRGRNDDIGRPPDDSYCKISAFRHQFIFTTVGGIHFTKTNPTSIVESWDNNDVARAALHNAAKGMIIDDAYMDTVASYWAQIIKSNWSSLCIFDREKCTKNIGLPGLGMHSRTELTAGIFIGAKGLFIRSAEIDFDSDMTKMLNPVEYKISAALNQCWPCGQGEQICAAGSHMDAAAQFCSERKPNTKLSVRTALTRADEHAKLAVQIVEETIDTYEGTSGDVGGAVDAVTITKDGKITWNARKKNCPENQD